MHSIHSSSKQQIEEKSVTGFLFSPVLLSDIRWKEIFSKAFKQLYKASPILKETGGPDASLWVSTEEHIIIHELEGSVPSLWVDKQASL